MLFHRHSIFALSCLLKITGNSESKAQTTTIMTDLTDIASPVVVSTYNSTPALMKPNDGGATPTRATTKKGEIHLIIHNGSEDHLLIYSTSDSWLLDQSEYHSKPNSWNDNDFDFFLYMFRYTCWLFLFYLSVLFMGSYYRVLEHVGKITSQLLMGYSWANCSTWCLAGSFTVKGHLCSDFIMCTMVSFYPTHFHLNGCALRLFENMAGTALFCFVFQEFSKVLC